MNARLELELKMALLSTGLVQPVDSSAKAGYIELLCRQIPGQEKPWVKLMQILLMVAETNGIDLHLGRRYVLKGGQMVFGVYVKVSGKAKALDAAIKILSAELAKAKPELLTKQETRAQREQEEVDEEEEQDEPEVAPQPAPRKAKKVKAPANKTGRPLAPGQHPPPREPEPYTAEVFQRDPVTPPGTPPPRVKVVEKRRSDNGTVVEITEMPLPHTYKDLNSPSKPVFSESLGRFVGGGRGAKNAV